MTLQWPKHTFEERKQIYDLIQECQGTQGYEIPIDILNADDGMLNLELARVVSDRCMELEQCGYVKDAQKLKFKFHSITNPWFEKVKELRDSEQA